MVLDTCGTAQGMILRFPLVGRTDPAGQSGASVSFGTTLVSAAGGEYRLCWCKAGGFTPFERSCNWAEDFLVDAGRMYLRGPSLDQRRTCISGVACRVDGLLGLGLSDGDTVAVLDTCGAIEDSYGRGSGLGWHVASGPCVKTPDGCITSDNYPQNYDTNVFCEITVQQPLLGSVSAVAFSSEEDRDKLIINGVEYHGDVRGPQSVTPTATITWTSDSGSTTSGWKLCPERDGLASGQLVDKFPYSGSSFSVLETGALANWGGVPLSAAGGNYRLCWCAGAPAPCTRSVDMGSLDIVGVSPLFQDRTCVSGQTCEIQGILGHMLLADGDAIVVLDTCGTASEVASLTPQPFVPGNQSLDRENFTGNLTEPLYWGGSWWSPAISASGGTYRLCW